ncbi:MAG: hypothetical protein VKK04_18480 [Synechococcales bacterium]|nr:hypothetical protein [Synechococcales bacterium]
MKRATAIIVIGISAGIGIGLASAQVTRQADRPPSQTTIRKTSPAGSRPDPAAAAPASKPAPSAQAPAASVARPTTPRESVKQPASEAQASLQYVDAETTPDPALEQAILDYLSPELPCGTDENPVRYLHNEADLNGDGLKEAIAYLTGPQTCGTGGCTTLIYEPTEAGYELVTRLTLVNYPIVVSDETTQGWSDLVLTVEGGGATPGYRRLKYNGTTYPSNPSTQPPVADEDVSGKAFVVESASDYAAAPKLPMPRCQ